MNYKSKALFVIVVSSFFFLLIFLLRENVVNHIFQQQNREIQKKNDDIHEHSDFVHVSHIPRRVCDIRDYGAQNDIDFMSTLAINTAIDDCFQQGGGTVFIPSGEWFSGGIKLKSNINLFLDKDAKIIFSTNLADYLPVVFTRFQGIEFYNYAPLIYIKDGHNIAITGKGKLIGNGDYRESWTGGGNFKTARMNLYAMARDGIPVENRIFGNEEPGLRPSFVQFVNCTDIILDGFTVENGPMWTIHPIYSENFVVRNLTINTWNGNTDGIVIDSTKNVVIENSFFSTGDDAISIKSGLDEDGLRVARASENIRIHNITVIKGSSGVSIGSEMSGGVSDVYIRDSVFENTRHGFRIKTTRSRGGYINNIYVENIVMNNITGDVIDFNLAYSSDLKSSISRKPILKDIFVKNIRGKENERLVINMDGLSNSPMENIRIEDILFVSSERSVSLKKVNNVTLKNINIETIKNPVYEIKDSQSIHIEQSKCQKESNPCVLISGFKTKDIWLNNIDFYSAKKQVDIIEGAREEAVKISNTRVFEK